MRIAILVAFLALAGQSCWFGKPVRQTKKELSQTDAVDTLMTNDAEANDGFGDSESEDDISISKETRLRYPEFSLVFHDFKGYESEFEDGIRYFYYEPIESYPNLGISFNDDEFENGDYRETLIVKTDTLHLSEILFDDRINNTLIEIIPNNPDDKFAMYACYLSLIGEVIDYRKYSNEELEKLYEEALYFDEQTEYYPLRDSAHFYFRANPHTADMEEVTVVNGEVVPVKKRNTKAQINWEQHRYAEDLKRIKKKYQMRDTLVVIPREYDVTATLTKGKKLFGYGYQSFLFRVDRYTKNKWAETRYIVIAIAYGC